MAVTFLYQKIAANDDGDVCISARRRPSGSERRQSDQSDTQRSRPISQVVVNSVTTSSTRTPSRTTKHICRARHRQLQTDVDLLAVITFVCTPACYLLQCLSMFLC